MKHVFHKFGVLFVVVCVFIQCHFPCVVCSVCSSCVIVICVCVGQVVCVDVCLSNECNLWCVYCVWSRLASVPPCVFCVVCEPWFTCILWRYVLGACGVYCLA